MFLARFETWQCWPLRSAALHWQPPRGSPRRGPVELGPCRPARRC